MLQTAFGGVDQFPHPILIYRAFLHRRDALINGYIAVPGMSEADPKDQYKVLSHMTSSNIGSKRWCRLYTIQHI